MKPLLTLSLTLLLTLSLRSQCLPQPAPYLQNFDYITSLPPCTYNSNATIEPGGRTGNRLTLVSTSSVDGYIVLPELQIPSDSVEVSFWFRSAFMPPVTFAFAIGIITDTSDVVGSFVAMHYDSCSTNQWRECHFFTTGLPFPPFPTTRLAIHISHGRNSTVYLDDIDIHHIPTCVRPYRLSASNITSSSFDLSWRGDSTARIDVTDFAATTSHFVSSNPATVTGLSPYTAYTVTVTAFCDSSDTSLTSLPLSLTTRPFCATPHNVSISDLHANDFRLSWTSTNLSAGFTGSYALYRDSVLIDTGDINTSLRYITFSNLTPVTRYNLRGVIRSRCSDDNASADVPFNLSFTTLCHDVGSIYFTDITDSTAVIHLHDTSVTAWSYSCTLYGQHPDTCPVTYRYTSSDTIRRLLPGTTYYVYTSRLCGQASSPWSSPVTFTTTGTTPHAHCPQPYNPSLRSLSQTAAVIDWSDSTATPLWLLTAVPSSGHPSQTVVSYHPYYITSLDSSLSYSFYISTICSSVDTSAPTLLGSIPAFPVICYPVTYGPSLVSLTDTSITVTTRSTGYSALQFAIAPYPSYSAADTLLSLTGSDTVTFSNLTPNNSYTIYLRGICLHPTTLHADTTAWISGHFTTYAPSASLPFICDFENPSQNSLWKYVQSQTNKFVISSGVSNGGSNSLYVSYDNSSYAYNPSSTSYASAYVTLDLPSGDYDYSFDWESFGYAGFSYGRLLLLPSSVAMDYTLWISYLSNGSLPPGAIALDRNSPLQSSGSFSTLSGTFHITTPGTYNLVATWRNYLSGGSNPPLAVDNISITPRSCTLPSAHTLAAQSHRADIYVSSAIPGSSLLYGLSTDASAPDSYDTIPVTSSSFTLHLTPLSAATSYTLYLRNVCPDGSATLPFTISFTTGCGSVTSFPYSQSFESLPLDTPAASLLDPLCWSVLNYGAFNSSGIIYPTFQAVSSQHSVGDVSLRFTSFRKAPLFLILPDISDISLTRLTFDVRYESYSSGIITAGYMTDPADTSTFVPLTPTTYSSAWTSYATIFPNAPAGSRIAFRHQDATMFSFYSWLDNVVVNRLYQFPAYVDTICGNEDYTLHGFSVPSSQLPIGDTTLYRVDYAHNSGTIYTSHLHRLPLSYSVVTDTAPAHQPYIRGLFNIPDPHTYYYYADTLSSLGCDSTVELHLTVTLDSIVDTTLCHRQYLILGDTILRTSGTYTHTWIDPQRTVVTFHANLTVDTLRHTEIHDSIAAGTPYLFNDTLLTASGTYTATLHSRLTGCDSTVTLHLYVITTDLDHISDLQISLIPNPARTGQPVTLHIGNPDEIDHIDLITPLGRHILSISPSDATFTLNTASLYLLRITLRNGQTVLRKLIVR